MNANSNRPAVPTWLWAALSVGVFMLIGATLWSASDNPPSRAKVDVQPYQPPMGAGPAPYTEQPGTMPQTSDIPAPWVGSDGSRPVVTVTPVKPIPLATVKPPRPGKSAAKQISSVADMFPVGPIIRRQVMQQVIHIDRGQPVERVDPTPKQEEGFPGFTYGGTLWSFTGAFAKAAELELTPTGLELGGRGVYNLANATGPTNILFVQSKLDPGKYAIYR